MALFRLTIPKQHLVLLELHITQGQLESLENENAAQLTLVMEKKNCQVTQCVPIFKKYPVSPQFPPPPP